MIIFHRFYISIMIFVSVFLSFKSYALTESGSIIKNQAGATYIDSSNQTRYTTSNLVTTTIQQVASVSLISSQNKFGNAGKQVIFNHTLTNTGNDNDTFTINITPALSVISSFTIMPDLNTDGVPDVGATAITNGSSTELLAPGGTFNFVIIADIDSGAIDGNSDSIIVTATSDATTSGVAVTPLGLASESNTDQVTVTSNAIMQVTKKISKNSGPSPSENYRITFVYENTSDINMDIDQINGLILKDTLPEGMRFDGGLEWSIPDNNNITSKGTLTGVTDSFITSSGTQNLELITCIAPDTSCSTQDVITFKLDGLDANSSASVSFLVKIEDGLQSETLLNKGIYGYDENADGEVTGGEVDKLETNTVPFDIYASYDVLANNGGCSPEGSILLCNGIDDTTLENVVISDANQGERVEFVNYIWNTGNAEDIFNITHNGIGTFPSGTSIQLMKSDGVTPLSDSDQNGEKDTGLIPPKGSVSCGSGFIRDDTNEICGYRVVLVVSLPPSIFGLGPYQVTKTATSSNDITKSNTVKDILSDITISTVDLTNNFRASTSNTTVNECLTSSACGLGTGPEATPVTTSTGHAGEIKRFTLFVTNTSNIGDQYSLFYSSILPVDNSLPSGWSIVFRDINGSIITHTPVINPDEAYEFYADVTIDVAATSGTQDIYFRVKSETTLVEDIKLDRIIIDNSNRCLGILADSKGTIIPGGTVIYKHNLINTGNDDRTNVILSVTNSNSLFTSIIYEDTDNNDELSSGDNIISGTPPLIPLLSGNSNKVFFIKVLSAGNVSLGDVNITNVSASTDCGNANVTDTTIVSLTNVEIIKLQAPDFDCNGVVDPTYSYTTNSFTVKPNQCVLYELTATNIGAEPAYNIFINDVAPPFTTFRVVGDKPKLTSPMIGSINSISDGDVGDIIGSVGDLNSGEKSILEFGIRID